MSSHIQTFIVNNIQTYDKDIEFIHKHNTKDKPLNILFSGAIDKFVCISWFYETNLNCLWIKDNVPYNTYTNPKFKELIKKYSDNYPSAIMFGMSMGGLGALLHSQYIANCAAVIAVDCESRGITSDEFLSMYNGSNSCRVHLLCCANETEEKFHCQIAEKMNNVIIEKCPRSEHLGNIPSKKYLLILFDLYGTIGYNEYYVNAWKKINGTEFEWN